MSVGGKERSLTEGMHFVSVFILITEHLDSFFLIPSPLCTIAKYDKLSKIVSYLLVPPSSVSVLGAMYKQMFTNWGITSVT